MREKKKEVKSHYVSKIIYKNEFAYHNFKPNFYSVAFSTLTQNENIKTKFSKYSCEKFYVLFHQ